MRFISAFLFALAVVGSVCADGPDPKEARLRWLKGNYEEARELYEKIARDPQHAVVGAIGVSRNWQSEGEYDKALTAIDDALTKNDKSAELHARRAELLYLRGRWKDAEAAAEKSIAIDKDNFAARWVRAQLLRDRGELKKADEECRWFVKTYTIRSNAGNDIKDPDQLLLIGLAGCENARWHKLADQFKVILRDVYGDALAAEKAFWPAECEAGMLLLEKYNRPEAVQAFDKALTINPQAAEAMVGKGLAALQKYDVTEAEQYAERALKVNPKLPEALHLRADIWMMAGDFPAAMKELETARKVNPRDESTLGRIAACQFAQKKQGEFDALVKEVSQHNPTPGVFYTELADRLEERKQYAAAEGFYKKAIELRPMLPEPHNQLGMLMMRMGREKEARDILLKARDADPFNVRIFNTVRVLNHLDKYETIKTAHFELRFDPKTDLILARYMADQLDGMYDELAKQFDFQPKGLILVEVFNNHEMFSGRVVGVPDLHTIGACTGRMFAMVSPQGKGIGKPFNWSRVLRHELVHIFNLEQTDFQCPHWLTEGLAVSNEGFPRPPSWNQLLLEKVPANDLLNLDNINMGFIRPKSPTQWHQAYCQSQLYVEFMQKKYGAETVAGMLSAYRDGLDTAAGIKKVCKVDKAAFEKEYRAYLDEVVKSIQGKPAEKPMTLAQLQAAYEKQPEDLDLAARYAEQLAGRNRNGEARKLVELVLSKKKSHPLANYVKAELLRKAGSDDDARVLLEAALDKEQPEPKIVQLLGKMYFEAKELDKAAAMFELGLKSQPFEAKWLVELGRVYTQTGNKPKLIGVLKQLVMTDSDEFDQRKRLAKLLLEANRFDEAEKFARQALEIKINDAEAQDLVMQSLTGQGRKAEAEKLKKLLEK